jgi:hypothetical protein
MKLKWQNRSTRGETCPSATLSTINPTWSGPGKKALISITFPMCFPYFSQCTGLLTDWMTR